MAPPRLQGIFIYPIVFYLAIPGKLTMLVGQGFAFFVGGGLVLGMYFAVGLHLQPLSALKKLSHWIITVTHEAVLPVFHLGELGGPRCFTHLPSDNLVKNDRAGILGFMSMKSDSTACVLNNSVER